MRAGLVGIAALGLLAGCFRGPQHPPLNTPEKLTLIDCQRHVQPTICPGQQDCVDRAQALMRRVPRVERANWLVRNGCAPATIVRRANLLARWAAEPKKAVRASTRRKWAIQQWLRDMGCMLVAPYCMAMRQSRKTR